VKEMPQYYLLLIKFKKYVNKLYTKFPGIHATVRFL